MAAVTVLLEGAYLMGSLWFLVVDFLGAQFSFGDEVAKFFNALKVLIKDIGLVKVCAIFCILNMELHVNALVIF